METDLQKILNELKTKVKHGDIYHYDASVKKNFSELIKISLKLFPEEKSKITQLHSKITQKPHGPFGSDILQTCKFIEGLLEKKLKKDAKTFRNYSDLLKEATLALRQGNESYSINLCDSAIESFLKEMFDIPSTIVSAGTVKFLSECMILNIPQGMELYLKEAKNKVCQMDNQVKHKAYIPSRLDAINALKTTEELFARKNIFKNITKEEKIKIHHGIGLIKNNL